MHKSKLLIVLLTLFILFPEDSLLGQNRFSSAENQKIWEAKDRGDWVYTKQILKSGSPRQKILALEGLQSWSDSALRPVILKLAKKGPADIRIAAFMAIGQSRDSFYLPHLLKWCNKKKSAKIQEALWVAIGKCMTKSRIGSLAEKGKPTQPGYAEGVYRAMLRGAGAKQLTTQMAGILITQPVNERFYAAWYLARTPFRPDSNDVKHVLEYLETKPSQDLAIPLLIALSRSNASGTDSATIRKCLMGFLYSDNSLLQVSALRAILNGKIPISPDSVAALVKPGTDPALQLTVSEWFQKNCRQGALYPGLTYQPAVLNLLSGKTCSGNKPPLITTGSQYDKIWKLKTMETDYNQYPLIQNLLLQDHGPAVKTEAMASLIQCFNSKGFPDNLKQDFYETTILLISDADPGVLSVIANAICDKSVPLVLGETDYSQQLLKALDQCKSFIRIPGDMEALIDIEKAIGFIRGTQPVKVIPEWNHPVDWRYVAALKEKTRVKVVTAKGSFTMEMNVNEAPGSVAAILKLVEEGFYNGKYFHRMVPDFVVQGGCPRGDGYGSMNYTLRSEFSNGRYATGTVGLASSGPDTESCQWFVTHCPTPHLEGRYTIIGRVADGMDTIYKLGVGDRMERVEIVR